MGLEATDPVTRRHVRDFIEPANLPAFGRVVEALQRGDQDSWFGEIRLRSFATGNAIPTEMNAFLIAEPRSGRPLALATVTRDLTERKRAEEESAKLQAQLLQTQKMEAVGRLAGGIAHDFNNLLTVINCNCDLVLEDTGLARDLRANVEVVRDAGESAANLTRQLLAFSRKQVLQPVALDLNALLERIERMLRRVIGEDVELVTHLGRDLWPVRADAGQVEQVILNLAVNSRDAMPGGGKLTLETGNVLLDEEYSRQHAGVRPGEYVLLAVSDNGHGMDAATLARIFEPFFSTKGHLGTGLGLSTVHGIVQQSGGNVWVYSEPGRGTTFKIYLPRYAGGTAVAGASEKLPAVGSRVGTVLVVEDSPQVRALVVRLLLARGHQVLQAANAEEAVALTGSYCGSIDLLVTDVVLPGMSGRQMAERLVALRPELAVLYMSGYTENAIVHQGVLDPGIDFLAKPFTADGLLRKVETILQRQRA